MDDEALLRYSRQIMLQEVDVEGQQKLLDARILIIGLGGLGSPAAMYLASAGVGHLYLCDDDRVELSNLQRQIIHQTQHIGTAKTESAKSTIHALNPRTTTTCLDKRLTDTELERYTREVDLVLDCSDNFQTRFAVNRACVKQRKPLVSGATIRFEAQVAVFQPGEEDSPCYNCLYDDAGENNRESCSESGVLAPMPGVIGSIQALEAIKILLKIGNPLTGKLLLFDGLEMQWRKISLKRNLFCKTCGTL